MNIPMSKKKRAAWVKALRSGKYQQGRSRLASEVDGTLKYCCLGVLCDLAAEESICQERASQKYMYFDGDFIYPPPSVRKWAAKGNSLRNRVQWKVASQLLAKANDGGVTFDKIADMIEADEVVGF